MMQDASCKKNVLLVGHPTNAKTNHRLSPDFKTCFSGAKEHWIRVAQPS